VNASGEIDTARLAAALWAHGVHILRLPDGEASEPPAMSPADLVVALVGHPQARLRDAAPAAIVAASQDAPSIRAAGDGLGEAPKARFRALYTIAACLQRQWWTRLRLSLPGMARLEDAYAGVLELPSADTRHGRECLAAMDPALVGSCGEAFRIFLEEMEREQRLVAASRGRA